MNHDFISKLTGVGAAKAGDVVKVHYTGRLEDGTVFDTSEGNEPLSFTVGEGEVIPGFDQAVMGMRVGESKEVLIEVDLAYGERNESLSQTVSRDQINLGVAPEEGMSIEMHTPDGTIIPLVITEVTESTVTLDANHPLAGQPLRFALELVEIGA
ncbi:MAG: peptidylprolyl isomerase [Acidobacteriota bacterium]